MAKIITITTKVLDTAKHRLTCGFRGYEGHKGLDLTPADTSETPYVLAYADGTVIATGNVSGTPKKGTAACGTYCAIRHADGTITRYMHGKYNSLKVKKGDKVKKGQILMTFGRPTTGNSTGPHLHFDISYPSKPSCDYIKDTFCGETRYYVDPLPYLQKTNNTTTSPGKEYTHKVTTPLNIRSGPGVNYKKLNYEDFPAYVRKQMTEKLNYMPVGTKLIVSSTQKGWYNIAGNAWVSGNYTSKI